MTSPNNTWSLRATLLWGLLVAAVFLASQAVVAGLYVQFASAGLSLAEKELLRDQLVNDGDLLALATIISGLISGLLTLAIVALRGGRQWRAQLGFCAPRAWELLTWCLYFIAFLLALEWLTHIMDRPVTPDFMNEVYASADSKLLLFVAVVVVASVFEEVFFRGFLLEGLRGSRVGSAGGVLLTAALWSVVHIQYDLFGIASIFLIGLMLGIARLRTASLWTPIVLHALNNALAFFAMAYLS